MIFHSSANKTHFHKKGCALRLILKVRVFGTRKSPISLSCMNYVVDESLFKPEALVVRAKSNFGVFKE